MKEERKSVSLHSPLNQDKIAFITNFCSHYSIKPFELIAEKYDTLFYFTGGHEAYWEKRNKVYLGNFRGEYLNGLRIGNRYKISWRLFSLFWTPWDFMIKTIDDRFALPLCFMAAKMRRKPFILWAGLWHSPQSRIHRIFSIVTKFIYRWSDAIVVYGAHVRDYLIKLGIDEKKIFVAFHAMDNAQFSGNVPKERIQILRNELGLKQKKVILYVGRLEECKGLSYLAEALAKLPQNNFCMLFIGCGNQKEQLRTCCDQGGFEYKFLDYVDNKKLFEYYAIADIFVLPSITTRDFKEPWGLVINEAMNQGCPIIATDAVGAAAGGLVENGQNGYIIPEKNSEALKEAIDKLLRNDERRVEMGRNASEKIKQWTQENMVLGFTNAIEHVQQKGVKRESRRCHA